MAILFRILFTLGLLILHVSVLSAQPPQINSNAYGTPLTFISENPPYIIASNVPKYPTYLNCHVAVKIDKVLRAHLLSSKFYQDPSEADDDEDDKDDDNVPKPTDEEVRRHYQLQKEQQANKSIPQSNLLSTIRKGGRLRATRSLLGLLVYEWFKDDESLISSSTDNKIINPNGLSLFKNGTLKLQLTDSIAGEYRCQAKYIDDSKKFEIGPILSTATVVEVANLNTKKTSSAIDDAKNLTIFEGENVVLNCPFSNVPDGNYSWQFNNNSINIDISSKQKDVVRHFLLSNGSLLIVNSRISDLGKYRCKPRNQFAKKPFRSSFLMLFVMPRTDKGDNHESRLLPPLQNSTVKIKAGQILTLHCASLTNKISWTFTPRTSNIPINLLGFNNELKYVNVSVTKHDGIYNCSTVSDFQVFDVTIVTPPLFLEPLSSMETSVPAAIKFNCGVSGNPQPKVEWYKNGKKVPNNHVKHFDYPIIKFETIDPEDEGLYQCLARNDYGEVSNTFYLHIRPQILLNNGPGNVKCYPMDNNMIYVTFEREPSNKIQYFIATDSPREFMSQVSDEDTNSGKFKINTSNTKIVRPLKPFYLYMRNMVFENQLRVMMSPLSKPIVCATQGLEPKFVKAPNGIFLRWDTPDVGNISITGYTIQFLNNGTSNPLLFTDEMVGTYELWPTYVSWNDIDKKLEKMKVKNSNNSEWTEVRVHGNVTGLYIINTDEINVRILGSIQENGDLIEQDLQFINWTNIKSSSVSLEPLTISEIESRSVEVTWSGLDTIQCASICTVLKQAIHRDVEKFKCEKILSLSAKSFYLRNLQPTSNYDIFIRDCNKVTISTEENFQTKRDVPSAVTQSHIETDKGIVLHWQPPRNTNGDISHYFVEWTLRNFTHEQNVTGMSFRFPNTTNIDRFNITVRAFGEAGLGYPLIINPDKWGILPFNVIGSAEQQGATIYFDSFMIFAIVFISITLVVVVFCIIFLRRHRYCKNSNGIINSSDQSSFQPTATPLSENLRTDEMYEMQTLIPTSQMVMANGREAPLKMANPSNGGINDNQKILRTSTPTDDSVNQICIELPPIKADDDASFHINDNTKSSKGLLEAFNSKQIPTTEQKDLKNGQLKVNGNTSPFKCFQASGNNQNMSSGSSSFDSHRQLIDPNLCDGLNNSADRRKIGKSSSIETDNEEEDSEENVHDYDLNDSNLSSKPLQPMNWVFRRPLVPPNG